MDAPLDATGQRVLGALLEKEIATPDYYPLSLNALVNACNQKSNRDPVVEFDEATVENALESLRSAGLAFRQSGRDSRVPKHGERFTEHFNLGRPESALMCVLLLRGPQMPGELRGRSERLYPFEDLEGLEATLERLAGMGLVRRLERRPGARESRWMHLLGGEVEDAEAPVASAGSSVSSTPSDRERLAALEDEVATLKRQFEEFRARFE